MASVTNRMRGNPCGSMVSMPKELAQSRKFKESIEEALSEFSKRGDKTKDGKERNVNRVDPESVVVKSPRGTHWDIRCKR